MKKLLFWLVGALLFFLLLLRGVPFLINLYLNANADRIVSSLITRTSLFGDHQVSFGDIRLNYNYSGTYLKIQDIKVSPSLTLGDEFVKVDLSIDHLDIIGFNWSNYLLKNTILVDSAKIDQIKLVSFSPPLDSLQVRSSSRRPPSQTKGKDYELIAVNNFDLQNLSIELYNNLHDSVRVHLKDMYLQVRGFKLTKEDIENPQSLFHVDNVSGSIGEAAFHFDRFRQYALVKEIVLDTELRKMNFGYIALLNKQGKYTYTSQFPERQSWTKIDSAQMELRGFHIGNFLERGIIEIDTIFTFNPRVEIFVDKRKPENKDKRPQMIQALFSNLRQVIHVDHSFVRNGYIRIEERPNNQSPRSGMLYISELNAHVINISNYVERRGENKLLRLEGEGRLMGQGLINLLAQYDLESEKGDFTLKGTLGKMDLTLLDPMIKPQAHVSIESGKVNSVKFDITGNDFDGTGKLTVLYEDLEVVLLNADLDVDNNFFRRIGSFLANKLIIRSNNPKKNGEVVHGTVYYIRDTNKSMFAYWWQLIFSGLKSTLTGDDLEKLKIREQERHGLSTGQKPGAIPLIGGRKSEQAKQQEQLSRKERREERRQSKNKE